ncbi:uncharacterized protein PHACADRAFT_154580 [Phanerochaete carnosa HHB-10118-sp]|uniref:Uncharacterized protein n=1 Tax=Phanerochaete carnosa (strain HHB-10118-sp) TaxID=650164 RepID=K5VRZ8_PHACS|nr:uncharacterized protein PHACADRAFT_154580 [Phanerochaete carnosa HHB-10118-sp]EKM49319.1 hypothetical protein PHACADRAFT_154580 [Phanerochaete carnosa HHB-10118-sp]
MRARQCSVSSSPLADTTCAKLTISMPRTPVTSGHGEPFLSVAMTYLAGLRQNDGMQLTMRPSNAMFCPSVDLAAPMLIFYAGLGPAPMCRFLREWAIQ